MYCTNLLNDFPPCPPPHVIISFYVTFPRKLKFHNTTQAQAQAHGPM
jgi:hypothetical protein